MGWRLIKSLVALPGTALVLVPALLLWATAGTAVAAAPAAPAQPLFWLALVCLCLGLGLMIWTIAIFATFGKGTLAPWDPPVRLVVRGPYRHVRNPMITGVLLVLLAEAAFLRSWPLAGWWTCFFSANVIYFPCVEEKALEKRFGADYRSYKAQVPRWVPRVTPWRSP